jgi:hypothetical protein
LLRAERSETVGEEEMKQKTENSQLHRAGFSAIA